MSHPLTSDARERVKDGATVYRLAPSADPQVLQGGETRTVRFVFSDATVDHSNDTIAPSGWDLSIFRSNPTCLWAHDAMAPPIGRASNVGVVSNRLMGDITFAPPETYDFADTVFRLIKGKYLRACSVGFVPTKWKLTSDRNRPNGIDFLQQKLLEISITPIPANPSALSEAKRAGIDVRPLRTWAEKVLDGEITTMAPRQQVEQVHRATTPDQRLREVAALRRELPKPETTPASRKVEAADLARRLERDGFL